MLGLILITHGLQGVVVADLYQQADQIEAILQNYDPDKAGTIATGTQRIDLRQWIFELLQFPPGALQLSQQ